MRLLEQALRPVWLLFAVAAGLAQSPPAQANLIYRLTATGVKIDTPAPLFSTASVGGTITLADSVAPGMAFGAASVIDARLDFGGIVGTLADIAADIAPGPVQIFGTRSADGLSLSMLDFRFGFAPTTPGCSFVCAGQIILNSGIDPSNFIAIDDLAGSTLSVISSFSPSFVLVPAPAGGLAFGVGLLALGGVRGRRFVGWPAISDERRSSSRPPDGPVAPTA